MTQGTAGATPEGAGPAAPTAPHALPWGALVFSMVLIALCAIALNATFGIRTTKVDDVFGPKLLPQVLAAVVGLGGVVTLVQTIVRFRRGPDGADEPPPEAGDLATELAAETPIEPARIGPVPVSAAIVAMMVLYVLLTQYVGFHISTVLFCVGALLVAGVRRISTLVVFPVATVLFLYLVFELLLGVRFP
jgi:hypothetical protein